MSGAEFVRGRDVSESYTPLSTVLTKNEACIGVLGIQDICHSNSRDIGYNPFYFQGYGILCSITGILLFSSTINKCKVEGQKKINKKVN